MALTGLKRYSLLWMCSEMPGLCLSEHKYYLSNFLHKFECIWIPWTSCFQNERGDLSVQWVISSIYLLVFEEAALSTAAPALAAVTKICDWAYIYGTVTSHASGLLCNQGIKVAPSGHFPSVRNKPIDSLHSEICAFLMALHIMSLIRVSDMFWGTLSAR